MHAQRAGPSSADVATEANTLLAGLGILTFAIFPLALPGLLLFVVAPLALVAMVGLLATPFVLPLWLARTVRRSRSRRRSPTGSPRSPSRSWTLGSTR
jgi:hypothetical protein